MSLDGYIARRNGDLDFLTIDKEGEEIMADFFSKVDVTIMGRKTAVGWIKMYKRGEIPDTPEMTNYVFSRRWKAGPREGYEVIGGSLTAFVRKLKRQRGKDIYLAGGGGLARSFLKDDLVDELYLGVGPILLGDGIPGFPGKFPQREFKLIECKAYSNGSVGLRYVRARAKANSKFRRTTAGRRLFQSANTRIRPCRKCSGAGRFPRIGCRSRNCDDRPGQNTGYPERS